MKKMKHSPPKMWIFATLWDCDVKYGHVSWSHYQDLAILMCLTIKYLGKINCAFVRSEGHYVKRSIHAERVAHRNTLRLLCPDGHAPLTLS
ncbi:MAG: hypothetical protein AAGG00_18010, partial [Cyanobacteria bacterium P01_H01_bin.150]